MLQARKSIYIIVITISTKQNKQCLHTNLTRIKYVTESHSNIKIALWFQAIRLSEREEKKEKKEKEGKSTC